MLHLINTTCPYDKWVPTARKLCVDPNRYHCLYDEFARSGWLCADPIWVEGGRCPEFNSVAKKLDTVPCTGKNCPDAVYQSSYVHLYLGCRRNGVDKATTSTSLGLTTDTGASDDPSSIGITGGVIAGVVLFIIGVAVLCLLLRRRRQNKKEMDPEAGLAMLATPDPDDERSYSRAQRALRAERFVVITGIQGAGKTFLARRLCDEWLQEDKCVWITDPSSFPVLTDIDSVFILDDLFHELQPEEKVREIKANVDSLYENVVVKSNGKIILTVTSLILRRNESVFEGRKYKNIINLDQLSKVDREEILQYHMKLNNISNENSRNQNSSIFLRDEDFQRMVEFNSQGSFDSHVEKGIGYSAVIALCCKMTIDKQKEFDDKCGRFVKSPISWIRNYLKDMLNGNNMERKPEAIALSSLALHGGRLKLSNLNTTMVNKLTELEKVKPVEEEVLKQSLTILKSKFVNENEDVYSFQVPVLMKILFSIICEKHKELLQFCEEDLCERRVLASSSFPSDIKGYYAKSFLKHF